MDTLKHAFDSQHFNFDSEELRTEFDDSFKSVEAFNKFFHDILIVENPTENNLEELRFIFDIAVEEYNHYQVKFVEFIKIMEILIKIFKENT